MERSNCSIDATVDGSADAMLFDVMVQIDGAVGQCIYTIDAPADETVKATV